MAVMFWSRWSHDGNDDCDYGGGDVVGDGHGIYDHPLRKHIAFIMMKQQINK